MYSTFLDRDWNEKKYFLCKSDSIKLGPFLISFRVSNVLCNMSHFEAFLIKNKYWKPDTKVKNVKNFFVYFKKPTFLMHQASQNYKYLLL